MDRRDGTVLIGKLLTPHFAPAALSSEESQLVNNDQVYKVLYHDHQYSYSCFLINDSMDGRRVGKRQAGRLSEAADRDTDSSYYI